MKNEDWAACFNCGHSDVELCSYCQEKALNRIQHARAWLNAMHNGKTEREALSFLYGELPQKVLAWIED
jgi:hypothetical protein